MLPVFGAPSTNIPTLKPRILYVQYTNPAALPPLEHSSLILGDKGWDVLFLGIDGIESLTFDPHPCIRLKRMKYCNPGFLQKLHYLRYCAWVLWTIVIWRPRCLYASDTFGAPLAWLATLFPSLRVIYHEHDSPTPTAEPLMKLLAAFRGRLYTKALCVWPNEHRGQLVAPQCVHRAVVWNCPGRAEVRAARPVEAVAKLDVFYHGSIVPARLPATVVEALPLLPDGVRLTVAGYETVSSRGYVHKLRNIARQMGVEHRFRYAGAIPRRTDLLALCRQADVGIAFMPLRDRGDINVSNMTGASNKPFDYLSQGLALLVSNRPDWKTMFVDAGFGLSCNQDDPASIASALRWFMDHPDDRRGMGERGRQRILHEWNYETQFQPIVEWLNNS
jgi:glycosyltransferase involved in cell wall biosynthesis